MLQNTSIVDNETIFDSPLRGNFGPTSTTCSAIAHSAA